ncbi:SdiA-regulated domain-containing protein [Patulibacter minatonensis]|uniref:SdiA-regulated domain-containing protein n=1 Tax=Patulibacter minatonensis TaxID=298163 RepID=UPI000684A6F9|nr:SdiA-regulated domain-containing protein [Patulibacter minatonensis]
MNDPARVVTHRSSRRRAVRAVAVGLAATASALAAQPIAAASAAPLSGVDLSTYVRVGRYDLPEPTRTVAPAGSLLAQEASGVAYNWDTDSLFVVGDGGTSVTQVSKTNGALIDSMTLAAGSSPQGTTFYDNEGITYIGNGQFVMTEERDRQLVRFTYAPGTTLTRAQTKTVKLGTTIGNVGFEGVSNDPKTGGFLVAKEKDPKGLFQTGIDWDAGTATNGSPTATGSTDLFDPALVPTTDISDVFSLSNLSGLTGPDKDRMLLISQESGKIVKVDRSGNVSGTLTIVGDADTPKSIPDQTHEGVTMDDAGRIYTVSEEGGGDIDHPQLWVYAPSTATNLAPTAVALTNRTASIAENSSTATRVKVADVSVTDDGIGTNQLSVTGPDASSFEVESTGLYLKAGTTLNAATKSSYTVSVAVDDPAVGTTPDATSTPYTLNVTPVAGGGQAPSVIVSEVSPWSSGNSPYAADWWELTNTGTTTIDLTGWKVDDDSASAASAVALNGVPRLAPGQSAVFIEGTATQADAFKSAWFGSSVPAGFQIGTYSGGGIGLGTGGDQVNVFDATGTRVTGIAFDASTSGRTFDNTAGLGGTVAPLPKVATLSTAGQNGASTVGGETGSPGVAPVPTPVAVTEVAPWGSSDATYAADWWEVTNTSNRTVDLTGWKVDDNSNAFASAVALSGVGTLAPGQSAIFLEGDATKVAAFKSAWFGSSVPAGFQIGFYSGGGVGLSTTADAVNLFNGSGDRVTGVAFGASTDKVSFDNAEGRGSFTLPLPVISTLSVVGQRGAFLAHDEIASPGTIKNAAVGPKLTTDTPSFPAQEVGTTGPGQWVTLTNSGDAAVTIGRVSIREADEASAGDFLLTSDRCTDQSIAPGATCKVQVRFSPGRATATSAAALVIPSNVAGSPTTVSLTAASTAATAGPKGDTGAAGPKGDTGAAGTNGKDGAAGSNGKDGAAGTNGTDGKDGATGPQGAQGPAGRDGTFAIVASRSKVAARRGRLVTLKLELANDTTAEVGRFGARITTAKGLRTTGAKRVVVHSIEPGKARTLVLRLRVLRTTKVGTHAVKVAFAVGGRTVTRTIAVRVTR